MRRIAAAALILLLASFTVPPAAAEAPTLVWDQDRVISSAVVVYENETLEIRGGVNIRFVPDDGGENGTRPTLGVMGGLFVNGTAASRVNLTADETLWLEGSEPDCLNIFNDGRTDRLSVQNATFRDMVIRIYFSGGAFRNCVFDRCDLSVFRSELSLTNCTFIYSTVGSGDMSGGEGGGPAVSLSGCRFDGLDPGSHPPPPYDTGDPKSPYARTAIELWEPVRVEDCLVSGYRTALSTGLNNTFIQNCTVRDCGQGMLLEGSSAADTAEVRGCTVENVTGFGLFALGGLRAKDCVLRDCAEAGVYSYGPLLLANCTIERCGTGVSLHAAELATPPDWLLLGNRLLGCTGYAVSAEGQAADISGNRFEDGNLSNGLGRLLVSWPVRLEVQDPTGRTLSGTFVLDWTDGSGGSRSQTIYPGDLVPFKEYSIDNSGARTDYFPYTMRLSRGAIENRTVLPSPAGSFTFVLQVLPDLVPVHLSTDRETVLYHQDISFLVRVQNNGAGVSRECIVVFLIDGMEVDRTRVPAIPQRATASVYSHPWEATAGHHTLTARVDPLGTVPESNRTNNNLSTAFDVSEPADRGFLTVGDSGLSSLMIMVLVTVLILSYVLVVVRVAQRRRRKKPGSPSEPDSEVPVGFSWKETGTTDGAPEAKGDGPQKAGGAGAGKGGGKGAVAAAEEGAGTGVREAAEPKPATIPGETKAARIKCPKCRTEAQVMDPTRPLTIECENCHSRLRLMK